MTSREEKAADARRRVELGEQQARRESQRAQEIIDAFLPQMKATGIEPVPLRATTLEGKQVRTDKRGWYIRQSRTMAIGEDGAFYSLLVPAGWMERLRGVSLEPSPPPLHIGKGGRDGETGELREFLQWTLEGRVAQD